jgi:hypothetical protein
MTKVTVELELDETAYRAKYGPGTEWWKRYHTDYVKGDDGHVIIDESGSAVKTVKPESEYKPMEGQRLYEAIIDILNEGFYDWASQGWLKLKVDGKPVRSCCSTVEGDGHMGHCKSIAGPEAS